MCKKLYIKWQEKQVFFVSLLFKKGREKGLFICEGCLVDILAKGGGYLFRVRCLLEGGHL